MGVCKDSVEIGCIESLSTIDSKGVLQNLKYVGPSLADVADIKENLDLGVPRSSSPQIFKNDSDQLFLVNANLLYIFGENPTPKLEVNVVPVIREESERFKAPYQGVFKSPINNSGVATIFDLESGCLGQSKGICFRPSNRPFPAKFSLELRIPKKVSGWIKARLENPIFNVEDYSNLSRRLKVEAGSVSIPIAGGWVKYEKLPSGFVDMIYPSGGYDKNPDASYILVADASQSGRGFV